MYFLNGFDNYNKVLHDTNIRRTLHSSSNGECLSWLSWYSNWKQVGKHSKGSLSIYSNHSLGPIHGSYIKSLCGVWAYVWWLTKYILGMTASMYLEVDEETLGKVISYTCRLMFNIVEWWSLLMYVLGLNATNKVGNYSPI